MKKLLLVLLVLTMGFAGCTDKKKQNSENTLNVEQEKEINRLDSETQEIDNAKKDLEDSSKELDKLLEDIE